MGKKNVFDWLNDCEICNAGLCANVDQLKEECGSVNKACKRMEEEAAEKFGTVVWTSKQIMDRYRYHKSLESREKGFGNSETNSNQKSQKQHFAIVAKRLNAIAKYISANCEWPPDIPRPALGKVIDAHNLVNLLLEDLE